MEVAITDITEVEKEISVSTTPQELAPHFEEAYKRQIPKLEIKGFRKGKAPLDMVKKLHGEAIEYGALDTIASDFYRQIITERDIQPIGEPVLTDIDYKRGSGLSFKIKFEIKPVVRLQQYKGIPVERTIHQVTDEDVDGEILHLQQSNSTLEEVQTATSVEHVVTADVQQLDEFGTPLIGKKNADMKIYLAGGTVYKQIRDALVNGSTGESRKVKFESEHEGKKVPNHVEIRLKKIERVVLPEVNEEFVKKLTKEKVTSVDDFKKGLRADIEQYAKEQDERAFVDSLINEIVRRHEFTVPESLVKGITDSMIEDMKNRYPNKQLPPDFNESTFRESNRSYAYAQAKWYLIREQIIEAEGLAVEDAELEEIAEREAPKIGIERDRLLSFYKSSDSVREKLLTDKLLKFLREHAAVTERVAERHEHDHTH